MEHGNSSYKAAKHFGERDRCEYYHSMFRKWYKNKNSIETHSNLMKRVKGGGRKTSLGELEGILLSEILELRMM